MSSRRPRNGLMNDAPALAAQTACVAEKQSVTLTLIPSSLRILVASNPAAVSGHLITTFGAIFTYSRPCLSISSRLSVVTSADTGPDTILQISATWVLKSTLPSFDTSVGLVVTPSHNPSAAA